jgi:hypothetical protein
VFLDFSVFANQSLPTTLLSGDENQNVGKFNRFGFAVSRQIHFVVVFTEQFHFWDHFFDHSTRLRLRTFFILEVGGLQSSLEFM